MDHFLSSSWSSGKESAVRQTSRGHAESSGQLSLALAGLTKSGAGLLRRLLLIVTSTSASTRGVGWLFSGWCQKQRRGCSFCFHSLVETKEEDML